MKRMISLAVSLAAVLGGCAVVPVGPPPPVAVVGHGPPPVYYGYRPWGYHWRHGGYHGFRGYPGWHR